MWADGGQVKVGWNSPAYGVGIEANQVGGWARGFGFLDGAGRASPSSAHMAAQTRFRFVYRPVPGLCRDVHAQYEGLALLWRRKPDGGFQRGGTDGGIYVPMTPINLTDASSNVWSGAGRATGTIRST